MRYVLPLWETLTVVKPLFLTIKLELDKKSPTMLV